MITTVATAFIALYTYFLYVLQSEQHRENVRQAKAKEKIDLFEKRFAIYLEVQNYMSIFVRDGKPNQSDANVMRRNCEAAKFIFPTEIHDYIEELSHKSFEYQINFVVWEPLRERAWNREELSPDERAQSDAALAEMHDRQSWFLNQWQTGAVERRFRPFLDLNSMS